MLKRILLIIAIGVAMPKALALDPIFTPWHNNLAIRGYDPVAYFTENKAVEGDEQYEFEWKEATWRFASAANRETFQSAPEEYAPQYGGYCAYAVADNNTASIEPEQFSIVDGKLYLNYNKKIQEKWLKKQSEYINQADLNWPQLLQN